MKLRVGRLAAFLILINLVALPAFAQTQPPFEIPVILSLTGPLAFVGTSELEALKALEPVVNAQGGIHGRPVHFTTQDDQSQPAVAVQLASGIIAKHVPVLLGSTLGASCLAIAPLIKSQADLIDYCLAPTIHPPAGSFQFSGGASSRDYAIETLVFAKAKGWKRIASIATTDAGSQDIESQFGQLLTEPRFSGMTFVASEHFNASDISVSSQLTRIKAARPQMLLALPVGTATGTVFRGITDAGMSDLPVMTNNGNLLRAQLAQYAAIMPKQLYFSAPRFYSYDVSRPGPVRDAQRAFYGAMKAAGVGQPDTGNNFGWDPAMLVISVLRKLPPNADATQIHAAIEDLTGYAGTNGLYDFRDGSQRGQTVSNTVIVQWNPTMKSVATVSEYGGAPLKR